MLFRSKGQAHAVNKGIRAANGQIIGWLNSDDILYPGAISHIVKFFDANPGVDVVYGMADHVGLDDRAFELYPTEAWDFERLKETCFICQPALFFRRRVAEKHGLLDESLNYCMDYEYWLRLGKTGMRFAYIEEKLAGSRLYIENKTMSARVKVHKEINDMLKKTFGQVPDRWLFNYAHVVVENEVSRDRYPFRFKLGLLFSSLWAAFRWNGKISNGYCRTLARWFKDLIREHVKKVTKH